MRESGKRPAARQLRGSQPLISEHSAGTEGLPPIGAAAHWQQTLWAMVGIQFVMTAAFSMLTPIMPLFLPVLGVESEAAIDIWSGILNGITSLVAAFSSPLWSRVPEDRLGYSLGWLSTGQLVGSLVGPIIGGMLADMTGSYRVPFYVTSATIFVAMGLVWYAVKEEFSRAGLGSGGRRGTLASLYALVTTPALLALFFVLLMAQFGVRTVQPIVTLYVKEMVGDLPNLATLAGIAFSITGLANVISAQFLGNRSDRIGYRRVLLICLAGGTLTTLPQAFTDNYWVFTAERFAVGLFIGGLLPTANALVGRLVSRAERGAVYGMTSSAMFLGNSMGPLLGGAIAASFGLSWVFLMTAIVMAANLLWVYHRVPEYAGGNA